MNVPLPRSAGSSTRKAIADAGHPAQKKSDVRNQENAAAPRAQRPTGVLARQAQSSDVATKPHFSPDGWVFAEEYYAPSILGAHVLSGIRKELQQHAGTKWTIAQDLASAHAAKDTKAYLARKCVAVLPWLPEGRDAGPLDIFVWRPVGGKVRSLPAAEIYAQAKLRAGLATVLGDLAAGPAWVERAGRCRKGVNRQSEWVLVNSGPEIPKWEFWDLKTFAPGRKGLVAACAGSSGNCCVSSASVRNPYFAIWRRVRK